MLKPSIWMVFETLNRSDLHTGRFGRFSVSYFSRKAWIPKLSSKFRNKLSTFVLLPQRSHPIQFTKSICIISPTNRDSRSFKRLKRGDAVGKKSAKHNVFHADQMLVTNRHSAKQSVLPLDKSLSIFYIWSKASERRNTQTTGTKFILYSSYIL